jgi:signal peptidase I
MESNRKINSIEKGAPPPWSRLLSRHRLLSAAALLLLLAFTARMTLLEGYIASDDAMSPLLEQGDRFLVNKLTVGFRLPFTDMRLLRLKRLSRGDVVVFAYPDDPSKVMIRRVVGLPGDVVEFRNKALILNGVSHPEPYARHVEKNIIPLEQHPRDNRKPLQVPMGSYFLLGDNRDRAYDSRFIGPVADRHVRGVVLFRYWRSRT